MKRTIIFFLCLYFFTAQAKHCEECALKYIITGHYTAIGRLPDSEHTYTSSIDIKELKDHSYSAIEKIKPNENRNWRGQFKKASPGEGYVLHLERQKDHLACLVSIDLDNYARLTCLWKKSNQKSNKLGYVALFPQIN